MQSKRASQVAEARLVLVWFRCPGSEVALQALTQRKVDLAFRVYQALLGAAADGHEDGAQAMHTDAQLHQVPLFSC